MGDHVRWMRVGIAAVLLAIPSHAWAQLPNVDPGCANFWAYYELWGFWNPCSYNYQAYVPSTSQTVGYGEAISGYTDCADYPYGTSLRCIDLNVVGDYDVVVNLTYAMYFGGAKFNVLVNGESIGHTTIDTGPWGIPWTGPGVGAPIGAYPVHLCTGTYRITFLETSMGGHSPLDVCEQAMGHIPLGFTIDYTIHQPSGSTAPSLSEVAGRAPISESSATFDVGTTLRVAPNPSDRNTSLYIRSQENTPARLELGVYDIRGARVWSAVQDVGPHQEIALTWDGQTEHGTPARTGVYFVRGRLGQTQLRASIIRQRGLGAGPAPFIASRSPRSSLLSTFPPSTRSLVGGGLQPQSNVTPPGDDGGGDGGTPPPPDDIEAHIQRVQPFVHMNPDTTYSIDTNGLSAAGVTQADWDLAQLLADLLAAIARRQSIGAIALKFGADWIWNHPALLEQLIQTIPGGDPCGGFRHPDPAPHYVCGNSALKATKEEVVAQVEALGFAPDPVVSQAPLKADKFSKLVNSPGCPINQREQVAYVFACGCGWNYIVNTNTQPNIEHLYDIPSPSITWIIYGLFWEDRLYKDALSTIPPSCCP